MTEYDDSQVDPENAGTTGEPDDSTGDADPNSGTDAVSEQGLLSAYQEAQQRLAEKTREADHYRGLVEQLGQDGNTRGRQADDEAFLNQVRDVFLRDPVAATDLMIRKAQQDMYRATDARISQALQDHRDFNRYFQEFLTEPANARLRPYESELEFLIRDKGLLPREAANLLLSIDNKRDVRTGTRSAAAKAIRNRSMVESEGEIGQPLDDEKELHRAFKKAKTLDEMFAALRKVGA